MYNKIGQVEYTAVGEGHISHYRRKELQKRTRRRLESSLLCWLGIMGRCTNVCIEVFLLSPRKSLVKGKSVFLLSTAVPQITTNLKHLRQQIFTVSRFCMLEVWEA